MQSQTTSNPSAPWAAAGEDADSEDMLIGNREGLEALRDAIDAALEKGEHFTSHQIDGFSGVRRVDGPRPTWNNESSWKSTLGGTGCLVLFLVCAGIFLLGVVQLQQLLTAK